MSMRSSSLYQILTFASILFLLFQHTCYSTELSQSKKDINIQICAEYARKINDLYDAERKITKEKIVTDKLEQIKKITKELEEKLGSTCPGIGFECKTFLSRPGKNICKPFKIQTKDRMVLKNYTYE